MNQDKKASTYQLTRAGIVILVITLVLSILCTTFGVKILVGKNENNSDSNKNTGNSSSNNSDNDTSTYTISEGSSKTLIVKSGKYYYFEFTPNSSETYFVYVNGACVTDIQNEYGGSVSYNERSTSSYDYSYTASLTAGTTYTIKVYTESTSMYLYLY